MATLKHREILLYSDTARSADALYFGRVDVPDAFVALSAGGKKVAIVSALEFGRVKRSSDFDLVLPLEGFVEKARRAWPGKKAGTSRVIALAAKELKVRMLSVPEDFPAGLYKELCDLGLRITISEGPLFPQREIKTPAEALALKEGNRCSAAGIAAAERPPSRMQGERPASLHKGSILTSERLKIAIETACIEEGSVSNSTIVAGGDQACDPHNRGIGPDPRP